MDKSNAVAFGTVNLKANVLSDVARPDGSGGQWVPSGLATKPVVIGEHSPTWGGQATPPSSSQPKLLGETRPGGPNGQGTGAKGPTPKRTTVLD